jgi:hypothetical protein
VLARSARKNFTSDSGENANTWRCPAVARFELAATRSELTTVPQTWVTGSSAA